MPLSGFGHGRNSAYSTLMYDLVKAVPQRLAESKRCGNGIEREVPSL